MCLEHIYGRVCVLSIIYDSVSRGNAAPVFEGLWSHALASDDAESGLCVMQVYGFGR